jgi:hypothetical protein
VKLPTNYDPSKASFSFGAVAEELRLASNPGGGLHRSQLNTEVIEVGLSHDRCFNDEGPRSATPRYARSFKRSAIAERGLA